MSACDRTPGTSVAVDLVTLCVRTGEGSWPVAMPAPAREAFLAGTWDATALLTADFDAVRVVEARLPYRCRRDLPDSWRPAASRTRGWVPLGAGFPRGCRLRHGLPAPTSCRHHRLSANS